MDKKSDFFGFCFEYLFYQKSKTNTSHINNTSLSHWINVLKIQQIYNTYLEISSKKKKKATL